METGTNSQNDEPAVPVTVAPKGFEDAVARSRNLRFPVVVKACSETIHAPIKRVRNHSDLVHIYRALCAWKDLCYGPMPLIQEFIPGFNEGFFAVY